MRAEREIDWERITIARARVLKELAHHRHERPAAEALNMTISGLRSHVRDLKDITGCESIDGLAEWWQRNGWRWLAQAARAGGMN